MQTSPQREPLRERLKQRWRRVRRHLEAPLIRLAMVVIPNLPRAAILTLAQGLGPIACVLSRRYRRIAQANAALVFGESHATADVRKITRQAFRTFSLVSLDMFWFSRDCAARVERYVHFDDSCQAYFDNEPAIVVTAHFGSWELLAIALAARGHPTMTVVAKLDHPAADALLHRIRTASGQIVVGRAGALSRVIEHLGKKGRTALAVDQNIMPQEGGCFVDFFGVPAAMTRATSTLSRKAGAPVIPMFCRAERDGTYCVYALPELWPLKGESAEAFAQRIAHVFEAEIRSRPEQWLWMYKRWKSFAPGRDRQGYPFYAQ